MPPVSAPRAPLTRGAALPYRVLAGVVPTRGGWLVASAKLQGITLSPENPVLMRTLMEVLDTKPSFSTVALAAPIGLFDDADQGQRPCDEAARKLLGWPRASAIVLPPFRKALGATNYAEARAANGGRLSAAQWRRMPRVIEIDKELAPYWQRTVFEVVPELAFYQLNGERPLRYSKHTSLGIEERTSLLGSKIPWLDRIVHGERPPSSEASLLDAAVCLWTTRRIVSRGIHRLPDQPTWDSTGLRMEIVF